MNTYKKIFFAFAFIIALCGFTTSIKADELNTPVDEPLVNGVTTTEDITEQSMVTESPVSPLDTEGDPVDSSAPSIVPVTKHATLHVRVGDSVVFEGEITVDDSAPVQIVDNTNSSHVVPFDSVLSILKKADDDSSAFDISNLQYYDSFDSFLLNCIQINQSETPEEKCYNWQFVVDGVYPAVGMNAYTVSDGADVYVYFGNPKRVIVEGDEVIAQGLFYAKAEIYHYVDNTWDTIPGTVLGVVYADPLDPWTNIVVSTSTTDNNGRALFSAPARAGTYGVGIESDYYYPTSPLDVVDAPDMISVLLKVRSGDTVSIDKVFNIEKGLDVLMSDSHKNEASIKSESVLNLLRLADAESDDFDLTDIKYYSDFDSFLINCVQIESGASPLCNNWQYAVNSSYPFVGTNAYNLDSGDKVYLYFGNQKRITPPSVVKVGVPFELRAEKYNYDDGSWSPIENTMIGRVVTNPLDPYTPDVVATSTTDVNGVAVFSVSNTGRYDFGFADEYYYPLYAVTAVLDSGGGGGSNTTNHKAPNVEKFITFLDSQQKQDGSFGSDLYTDWAAIAYGSVSGHTNARSKLKEYLKSDSLSSHPSVTDYERRAMALMALGVNPYTGSVSDYISPIVASFDDEQFGDKDLVNDDVFAIIALLKAGYSSEDAEILKSRDYITKSILDAKGAFENIDIAGAMIQALSSASLSDESRNVIGLAKEYILKHQKPDGGFSLDGTVSNNSSTSWALGSLKLLGVDVSALINGDNNPFDYIASIQMEDGGIEDETTPDINSRVWATSYAVVGVQEKAWKDILKSFNRTTRTSADSNNTPSVEEPDTVINPNTTPVENIVVTKDVILAQKTTLPQPENPQVTLEENNTEHSVPNTNIAAVGVYQNKFILWLGGGSILAGLILLVRKWIQI